ncbi:serine/threonine protein kinase [Bacillus sp. DNRA2]|uniref:serine/threonine protein kinase n=1 Tax=Bacillus sp. DNRA2 TaxID=2723053 RepID=UPI00145F1382|nr:serine/threonine protein kinase [Bacillus sp. DNRA2]NMD68970.1 serine/threonine protein kinase [Bacillus sp. DNRA2]
MVTENYIRLIEEELLPHITLKADDLFEPIKVTNRSDSWKLLGNGNYAAVFYHKSKPDLVVKVYGRNHHELAKEVEVYNKIGKHQAFSQLLAHSDQYLVLKRLNGITLFNAVIKGVQIPNSVINDIDAALEYAKSVGLNPYDVHGKNVVMNGTKGFVVDISDFYKTGYCSKWDDLKKAYKWIYKPLLYRFHPPIPFVILDSVRKGYRKLKQMRSLWGKYYLNKETKM